ncbi:SRPBCC family protein [Kitasatospora sp. NPDC059571]|uniref:SRPBCC family protein n=1 Tax=Kitasatospora sp. NPDC059571 TaxID=3346871 RepID=UPI0036B7016B
MNVDTEAHSGDWPVAEFDEVRALRVLAATVPGAAVHETVLDSPLEEVWAVAADLAGALPRWLPDIRSVEVSAEGDEAVVVGHSRLRARFDIEMRPGWCLMQSRFLLGGMAAAQEPDGTTRFAFLGAFRVPSAGPVGAVLRPLTRRLGRRSLRRFEALVAGRRPARPGEHMHGEELRGGEVPPVSDR